MALVEINEEQGLVPFRQLRGGADLYEIEIESLLWDNLQDLTEELLFPVRRQAPIAGGGYPDIVALDSTGAVVVIEVKRSVDRSQLAQCLEYAGWARTTSLDELAGFYHGGPAKFWADWMAFTGSEQPRLVNRAPRLIIVARSLDDRTGSAVEFLRTNGVPITVLRMGMFEDAAGRRFLDAELEGDSAVRATSTPARTPTLPRSRAVFSVSVADLVGAGLLQPGETLEWPRPRLGVVLTCTVEADGTLRLPNGASYGAPSTAATHAAGGGSFDGWECWVSPTAQATLKAHRERFLALQSEEEKAVS